MKKMFQTMWLLGVLVLIAACGDHSRFKYESVPGDPLNARIYTLDNGLKVYMTVNKDQPRIHPMSPSAPVERTIRQRRPGWPTILST